MNESHSQDSLSATAAATMLRQLIMGFRVTQLIYVAAKLGLADHLQQGPQTPQQLAQAVGAEPQALYRLLRALASPGLFAETNDGRFQLTPLARQLQRDVPGSLHSLALLYGDEWLWRAYGDMLYSVQTGLPAFDHVHGETIYDYLAHHQEAAMVFHQAMTAYSEQEAGAILSAYDFAGLRTVVDVGGGHGALLAAILRAYPAMLAVLFDQELVVADAHHLFVQKGVATRCECVGGDFFTSVPAGGEAYLLKSVLHNWDDEHSVTILKNCRRAMAEQARLLVVERVIPPGNEPAEAKLFDINMLVALGGLERTEAEYQALFQAAGFQLTRVIPTQSPLSIIEGMPIV